VARSLFKTIRLLTLATRCAMISGMGDVIRFERERARRLVPPPTRDYVPLERSALKLLRDCRGQDDPALIAALDELGSALTGWIRVYLRR